MTQLTRIKKFVLGNKYMRNDGKKVVINGVFYNHCIDDGDRRGDVYRGDDGIFYWTDGKSITFEPVNYYLFEEEK